MITKQQAWTIIAEAFETPHDLRLGAQHQITRRGLCAAVFVLVSQEQITELTCDEMREELKAQQPSLTSAYFWPPRLYGFVLNPEWTPQCDTNRAQLARELATKQ
jgi:hypothetical protein